MNTKIKTFISEQGEVFTGSQKDLMDQYGIKHKMGFTRPSGAVDAEGDRWKELTDDVKFTKPKMYLGPKVYWSRDHQGQRVAEIVDESMTALQYKMAVAGSHVDLKEEYMKEVESKYEIIDNRHESASASSMRRNYWDNALDKRLRMLGIVQK